MIKPVFLVDLDDTLFQTKRKMVDELEQVPFRVGALDRDFAPRSFMNEEQAMLVDWLLASTELIPVTARGTEEILRVKIPFQSWVITTHGAVLLTPEGTPDLEWQERMIAELDPYCQSLLTLQAWITELMEERGVNGWARINYEYGGTPIYLVMKHRDSTKLDELNAIGDEIEQILGTEGFYIHRNSNNIAWMPNCVEKGLAAKHLIDKLQAERGVFPLVGLGDSISDHRFLKLCSWFGMPKQSQLANTLNTALFEGLNG